MAAPHLADDEWLAAWRTFLLAMNHRRDVLRARLGGLVIAAPPAVKAVAQRESPDLWSVRDLLIELAPRPVATRSTGVPRSDVEQRQPGRSSSQGLSYESGDAELAEEAQVLLAMPVAELAGPARERISRAVHRAVARGDDQLAAVLLLAQSEGYRADSDSAGALHLLQEGLTLEGIEPRTRERLLDSGVELAIAITDLELAQRYAAEPVALIEQRGYQRRITTPCVISPTASAGSATSLAPSATPPPTTSKPSTSTGAWPNSSARYGPCKTCRRGSLISLRPRRNSVMPMPRRRCAPSWLLCRIASPR